MNSNQDLMVGDNGKEFKFEESAKEELRDVENNALEGECINDYLISKNRISDLTSMDIKFNEKNELKSENGKGKIEPTEGADHSENDTKKDNDFSFDIGDDFPMPPECRCHERQNNLTFENEEYDLESKDIELQQGEKDLESLEDEIISKLTDEKIKLQDDDEENILDDDDLDLEYQQDNPDEADDFFYQVIGKIEEVVMEDDFGDLLTNFMEKYWTEFDETEENKLSYSVIFKEYLETIEKFIEMKICEKLGPFSMEEFERKMRERQDDMDIQIYEILHSFSDFESFKSMILDYRRMKCGEAVDSSKDISIQKCETKIIDEEHPVG